jgi:hypothetical protein
MASITGFGGAFIRANDPKALYSWYERHLGPMKSEGSFAFPAPTQHPQVVFAFFGQEDAYFRGWLMPCRQKIDEGADDLGGKGLRRPAMVS